MKIKIVFGDRDASRFDEITISTSDCNSPEEWAGMILDIIAASQFPKSQILKSLGASD